MSYVERYKKRKELLEKIRKEEANTLANTPPRTPSLLR